MTKVDACLEPLGATRCRLRLRVTPRGGRDAIDGAQEIDGRARLLIRVAAPPADGAANAAALALLAKRLDLRKSALTLVQGATGRLIKTIEVEAAPETVAARLGALLAGASKSG